MKIATLLLFAIAATCASALNMQTNAEVSAERSTLSKELKRCNLLCARHNPFNPRKKK